MLLRDIDLRPLIQQSGLLTRFEPPSDWESKGSLVQPSSIDLHVGAIYKPGVKPGKPGSAGNPKSTLSLKTGETAIVETRELIRMPGDHAGFGFPPSSVSSRGLLMTNPGHVDPGFEGTLTFTVINMGREEFVLHPTLQIVTLLIFKLEGKVGKDYGERQSESTNSASSAVASTITPIEITQNQIDGLSSDFVDVTRRAGRIAARVVGWTALVASLVAAVSTAVVNSIENRIAKIDEMRLELVQLKDANARMQSDLDTAKGELEKEMALDQRVNNLEQQLKTRKGASDEKVNNVPKGSGN